MWLIETIWHFVWGWAGVDMIVGAAALAVAVLLPKQLDFITDLRKWAIGVAVVAFTFTGLIAHGYKNGLDEKQRQWDAALAREAVNGETARSDSERAVGPVTTDRGVFRGDPDNRDGERKQSGRHTEGALRRVAPYFLFRK